MSELTIEAEPRQTTGKEVRFLRQAGQVPGVIYGPKTETVSITLDERELDSLLVEAGGTSIIDVKVGKNTHQVLVREVQRDIIRGNLMHVDFYAADMERVTRVEVPIVLVGQSSVVASRTGVLLHGVTSVEVEGLPKDLVSEINVDLEDLTEIGMLVTVGDLYVPPELTIITDPSELVAKVDYLAIEEEELEEELVAPEEMAEPEVVGRRVEEGEETDEETAEE